MYSGKIINKIPGELPPMKKEKQGYIGDLRAKSRVEILDLLERQNKLLANKAFISKLADKGERISMFRQRLQQELDHRNEVDQAANLLSRLNIASEGKQAMNELEWTGKYDEKASFKKVVELDSDDDEDPLKILAQPTGTGVHKKKIITVVAQESLINDQDLKEIESFKKEEENNNEHATDSNKMESDGDKNEDHVNFIINKVEKEEKPKKEPFKPYKTTRSNVHDPEKEKIRKKYKYWEVTAATPPLIVHGAVKTLSINESMSLMTEQQEKLKMIQAKHAIARLTEQIGMHKLGSIPVGGTYRSERKDSISSDPETDEEEHEVHDEEDHDRAGTVVFPVDSIHE